LTLSKFYLPQQFCMAAFSSPFEVYFVRSVKTFHTQKPPSLLIC